MHYAYEKLRGREVLLKATLDIVFVQEFIEVGIRLVVFGSLGTRIRLTSFLWSGIGCYYLAH